MKGSDRCGVRHHTQSGLAGEVKVVCAPRIAASYGHDKGIYNFWKRTKTESMNGP